MNQTNQKQCNICGHSIEVTNEQSVSVACPACSHVRATPPASSEPTNPVKSTRSFFGKTVLGDLVATQTALTSIQKAKNLLMFMAVISFFSFIAGLVEMSFVLIEMLELKQQNILPVIAYLRILLLISILVITFLQAWYLFKLSISSNAVTPTCSSKDIDNVMLYQLKFWRVTGIVICIAIVYAFVAIQTESSIKKAKRNDKWSSR